MYCFGQKGVISKICFKLPVGASAWVAEPGVLALLGVVQWVIPTPSQSKGEASNSPTCQAFDFMGRLLCSGQCGR